MEPPKGILSSLWNFIFFLPYFIGLLILGLIKGILLCPLICLTMGIGNSAVILGLWLGHFFWAYYCILGSRQFSPSLKLILSFFATVLLILWPIVGILGSFIGGAAYGLLQPMFATFKAVGEGKTNKFIHCIYDGTVDTVKGSFTVVRDFTDVCYHSYFSILDDIRRQGFSEGKYYEIRSFYVPGSFIAGVLGVAVDVPVIFLIALCKSPYMLFKGWHRLFHDCIGREGPFLDTMCVPIAGLVILLWPLTVAAAMLGSILASIGLGAYAAVVVYQESSFVSGLRYIVASLSIYDEYSNDILDMPEGSCFPRPQYRKNDAGSGVSSVVTSLSRPNSIRNPPSRTASFKNPMVELKPLELLATLFEACQRHGERMASEGLITLQDIEDAKSSKDSSRVISIGLPAYSLLQTLLRSAKANSAGILLIDNTEITSTNRPKDTFFDWFLNPLLIIKDQIIAENLSEAEEEYLGKLVLLNGDPERLRKTNLGTPPDSERKRAELDALARRLRGITKSISRYPTFRRRFDTSIKTLSEDLATKNGSNKSTNGTQPLPRSKSAVGIARIFSTKSFHRKTSYHGPDQAVERDVEIA